MNTYGVVSSMKNCSKCGQKLPKSLDKKTLEKFNHMCDVWIRLLLQEKKQNIVLPSQMLENYTAPSVHCVKCNYDIGNTSTDDCPNCGFDVNESTTQWIIKHAKYELPRGNM